MKKCLVVIDMQKDFLDETGLLFIGHDTKKLVKKISNFISKFDSDIFVTLDTHNETCAEFDSFPKHCVKATHGHELDDSIKQSLNGKSLVYIEKNTYANEKLKDIALNYKEIHIVGVCTHICVHDICSYIVNTSKEVLDKIPKVFLHKDMIDDFNPEMALFAMKRLETLYSVEIV